jgi:hypothetical protein
MTVDGNLPCERQLSFGPRGGLRRRRGGSAHPDHPAQQDHQQHAPGQARQPPQLISQLTVASLPTKAIDDGTGPVDQSQTAQFVQSAPYLVGTSRRDNSSTTIRRSWQHHYPPFASDVTTGSAN